MNIPRASAALLITLLLAASGCASDPSSSPASPEAGAACTPGMDQTCNDSAEISSLHGTCQPDGTCTCQPQFEKNEATGRCK